ncbi:MAG: Rpn family recombination-promoting nuclease/putative transposase [Scytolyngbya sp. HA4215-MV1]|jgi:predicted transposase/invertase (TIGR01784 family)|nr:Rpn family recombination-promoting nuclease/putative transposase [Scytolyngbya sp. HA4215-MV1]
MRRDSIFYQLFRQSPALLFELLEQPPENAGEYRFDSVAVKEPKFEIDGVFLPPETEVPGVVYFCEVQFQRDERLYERLFAELFLYFYRNRDRYANWRAVIVYPDRRTEQGETLPYEVLLNSAQVQRVYLVELGDLAELPLGVALMVLTTVDEGEAPDAARALLVRAGRAALSEAASRAIMEMVTTIMVYKFTHLSRQEIERMLGITLQETRVYQEAKEEGRQEALVQMIGRLFNHRFQQELPEEVRSRLTTLSVPVLEDLGEALLDFGSLADLLTWLEALG